MATATLVTLSEYLNTTYRPDRDFLEGELLERNMGEQPHSRIQNYFSYIFRAHRDAWGLRSLPEQRVQVQPERYRVADIAVIALSDPSDRILYKAPILCIEILSSSDSLQSIQERVDDYAAMGVANIWVLNPWKRLGYHGTIDGYRQPEDGMLRVQGTAVVVSLSDVFAELDEA